MVRFWPHIVNKISKAKCPEPSIAYNDASTAVSVVEFMLGVVASLFHGFPAFILSWVLLSRATEFQHPIDRTVSFEPLIAFVTVAKTLYVIPVAAIGFTYFHVYMVSPSLL